MVAAQRQSSLPSNCDTRSIVQWIDTVQPLLKFSETTVNVDWLDETEPRQSTAGRSSPLLIAPPAT